MDIDFGARARDQRRLIDDILLLFVQTHECSFLE